MRHSLVGPRALLLGLLSAWAAEPAAALKQRQIPGATPEVLGATPEATPDPAPASTAGLRQPQWMPHLPNVPAPWEILDRLREGLTAPTTTLPLPPTPPPERRIKVKPYEPSNKARCTSQDFNAKDIDIVLFGSTGYMGSSFADYIMTHVQKPVRWVFAGRDPHKLSMQQQSLSSVSATGAVAPVSTMTVDLNNSKALLSMTKRAKIVISTVGPYQVYGGEELIKQAIEGCSHYMDLAVETLWRVKMMATYHKAAKNRGVVITQSVGMVSMVNDFLALYSANLMAGDGNGPPNSITLKVRKMNGMPTGGGALSAELERDNNTRNPYIFVPRATFAQRVDKNLEGLDGYGFNEDIGEEVFFYPGARTEPLIIRRTLFNMFPKQDISLKHVATREFLETTRAFIQNNSKVHFMPVRRPWPGEGPPGWILNEGSWKMEVLAIRKKPARRARVVIHGNRDPAVSATVRLCTSLALVLLEQGPLRGASGYLTPATVVDLNALKKSWLGIDEGHWMQIVHGYSHAATATVNPDGEILDQTPPEEMPVAEYLERRQMEDTASAKGLAEDGDDEVSKFMFSMMLGGGAAKPPAGYAEEARGADQAARELRRRGQPMPTGTLEEQEAEELKRPPWGHAPGKGWGAY